MRDFVDWTIEWTHDLPDGIAALTVWADRAVWVSASLSQVERRCVIEHERQHLIRGPGGSVAFEERAVDVATAHALIRLGDLVEAAKWARSLPELADELNVTQDVVHTRLRHLHPSERAVLRRARRDQQGMDEEEAG